MYLHSSRRLLFLVSALLLLSLTLTGPPVAFGEEAQVIAAQSTHTAVVGSGALNVRSGPGVNYGVVEVSYRGHVVALLGRNSNSTWAKVRLYSGKEGWVNAALILPSVPINTLPVMDTAVPPPTAFATIATGALNVRSGPGVSYNVVDVSYQGHVVALLGRISNNTWVKVRLFNGREGWVNASLIQPNIAISALLVVEAPAPPPPAAIATVISGALNVRSGPGVEYSVVEVSRQGHVVALLGRNSNSSWARVRLFSGREGWVNASLIQPNVAISSLPVVSSPAPPAPQAHATVISGALNVRSGPGVEYSVVEVSRQGHVVALLGRNSNSSWARVRLFSGREGWVNASLIQPNVAISSLPVVSSPAPPAPTAIIRTGALNVRTGPSVFFTPIAVVYNGQSVTVVGRNSYSSWVQVRLSNGQVGWVNASLVQLSVPIGNLPVTG